MERAARSRAAGGARLVALAAAVGALAPAAASAQAGVARASILEGELANDAFVVALVHESGAPFCTGTVVAPDVVLTAAHCLDAGPPDGVATLEGRVAVAWWSVHPDYDRVSLDGDLAVIGLERPLESVTPARLHRAPMGSEWVGREVRVAGFGLDAIGAIVSDGQLRSRATTVESIERDRIRHGESTCNGDSGGPLLDPAAPEPTLLGVVSSGPASCRHYGRATRVDVHLAWIEAALRPGTAASCAVGARRGSGAAQAALALVLALAAFRRARCRRFPTLATHSVGSRRQVLPRRRDLRANLGGTAHAEGTRTAQSVSLAPAMGTDAPLLSSRRLPHRPRARAGAGAGVRARRDRAHDAAGRGSR